MKETTSSRRKRWFFARAMARAYREWLEKHTRKSAKATPRTLFAEALEPRVLFSGAPVPVEQDTAGDDSAGQEAAQTAQLLDTGVAEVGKFSFDGEVSPDFTEEDLERLASEAVARWEATGLTQEQMEALERIRYSVTDLEGSVIGATEDDLIVLDIDAAGFDWFVDDTEWLDEEFVEIDGILKAASGEDMDGLALEGIDLLSVIMHEQGHILGLLDQRAYGDGGIMDGLFDEGERRIITSGVADGAVPGSLDGVHFAITSAGIAGDTLSIVGDVDSDSVELRINAGNYEYSVNGGGFTSLGSTTGVNNITIDMGGGTDSVTLSSAISITGTLTINAETITANQALTVGTAASLTGETVVFESTIDGAMALDVDASTLVRFRGDVGGTTPLASINTTGSAATEFGTGFPVVTGATSDLFNVDAGLDTDGNNRWEDTVTGNPTGLNFLLDSDTAGGSAVTRVTGTSSLPGIAGAYDLPGGFTGNVGGALLNLSSDPDTNTDEESFLNAPGNWTDESVSFEIWFKPDNLSPTPANGQILFEDGGGNGLGLLLDNNGDLWARKIGNTVEVRYSLSTDPNTLLTAGEFVQAVVTYNYTSGQLELFVNGSKVGDQTNAAAGNWTGGDGFGLGTLGDANVGGLGGGQQSTESFDGQIAIFRAYRDQVLTGAEVLNNYNAIAQVVPASINVATTGSQDYGDDVFLGLSTNLSAGSSDVSFAGSVDALPALGGLTLDIDTTGATSFNGVGGISIIPNLTLSNASSGALNLPGSGAVTLGGFIDTSAGNGSFTFNGDVESTSADATLVLNTGSGTVVFNGDFGATTNFGGITQLGTGTVTFGVGTSLATPLTNSVFVFSGPGGSTAAEFLVLGTIGTGQTGNNNGLQATNDATVTFGDGANAATVNISDAAGAAANLDTRNGGRFEFINLSAPVVFSDAPDNANGGDGTIVVGTGTNNPTIDFVGGNFEVAIGTGGIGYFEFLSGIINQNSNNLITGQGVGTQAGSLTDRVTIGGGPGATVEAWLNLNAGAPGDWNTNSGLGFAEILENGRVTARSLNMGSTDSGGLDLLIDGGTLELTGDIDFRNLGTANDKITFLDGVINGNADGVSGGTFFLRDSATTAFDFQGGILKGFATFNGTLTQDGGTVRVGNDAADFVSGDAPVTMTITRNYDLNAGVLDLTLGDVAALSADTLTVNGDVDLTGTGTLSLVQGAAYATAGAVEGATTLTLLSYAGTLTGEFAGLANGGELVVGTDVYTIDYGTGAASSITLTLQRINDVTAPVVSGAFTPTDDAVDVDVATDLVITFDEPVYAVEGATVTLYRDDQAPNTAEETFTFSAGSWSGDNGGSVTVDGAVVTIDPGANLGSTGQYHVEITGTSFENIGGLDFAGFTDATTWNFTAVDTAVPTTTVEVVGGVLTISDSDPFDTLDNITISQTGSTITITTTDQPLVIGSGVVAGANNRTATIDANTLTGLSIDTGGGADVVTLQGLNIAGDLSFTSVETINLEGIITTSGAQTYGKGQVVEISGNTTLSGTTITFDGNVNSAGAHDLIVNASTALEINANVGATNALGTFDTTGSALVKVGQSSAGSTLDTLQGDVVWNFDFSAAGTGATLVEDLAGARNAAGDSFRLLADETNSPTIAPPTGTNLPAGITAAGQFTGGTVAANGDGGFKIQAATADSSPLSVVPAVNDGDVSFEFWFAPDDLGTANPNNQMIWETGGGTGTGIAIMGTDSGSAGTLRFRNTTNGTEVDYDLAGNHAAGEWIHVVATMDLSTDTTDELKLFINGVEVGGNSTTSDITNWDGGDASALGASGGSNAGGWGSGVANPLAGAGSFESFNGQIGVFRMYRENLDTTQIVNNRDFQNSTSTGPTSVTIGAATHLHGTTTVGTNLNLNSSGTVTVGALDDDSVSSTPGNVTITASGVTTLSGPVGDSSPVQSLTVTATRIDVNTTSLEASGDLTLNSPVQLLSASNFTTGGSTVVSGTIDLGTFDLTVTGNGDISGAISGSGSLTKAGAGSSLLVLSANNDFTGGVTLAGGIVQADNNGALGDVGSSTLTFNGGTRLLVGNGVDVAQAIIIGSNSGAGAKGLIEAVSGTGTVSGSITINNSASAGGHFAGGGGTLQIIGDVISSVDVTQRAGTVEYLLGPGSSLSFLGITGTARLLGADGLTTGAEVRLGGSGDAVLDLNGFNHSIAGLSSASNGTSKRVQNGSATDATLTVTAASTFDGSIRDNIDLVVDATGETFTLDGSHTYSGTTTVTAGSLLLDGTLIGNPTVVAGYRADFDPDTQPANWQYLWNQNVIIGNPSGYSLMQDAGTLWTGTGDTATADTDDGALRLTANGGTPGLAGTPTNDQFAIAAYTVTADGLYAISDSFLTRGSTSGNGVSLRLFLNDSTTPFYSATVTSNNTRIFDQSLGYLSAGDTIYFAVGPNGNNASDNFTWDFSIVTGSASPGAITVESGAALGGSGATNSAVTVESGAILDPGTDSAGGGILRTGNLTLNGVLNIDIPAGGSADQVIVNGTADISGATLTGTAGSGLSFIAPFTIISNDAADGVVGSFASSQITLGSNTFDISTNGGDGNDVTLTLPNRAPVGTNLDQTRVYAPGAGVIIDLDPITVTDPDTASVVVVSELPFINFPDVQSGASFNSGFTSPDTARGFSFEIKFTPEEADVTPGGSGSENRRILFEIGGSSNGTGIYLIEGIPHFISKMNTPGNTTSSTTVGVADLDWEGGTGDGMVVIPLTAAPLVSGQATTLAGIFSLDELEYSANGAAPTSVALLNRNGTENWEGDNSVFIGVDTGSGGPGGLSTSGLFNAGSFAALSGTAPVDYARMWNVSDIFAPNPAIGTNLETITATLAIDGYVDAATTGSLASIGGGSFDAGAGIFTVTGDATTINAALASVQFTTGTATPANQAISVSIADGGEDGVVPLTGTINLIEAALTVTAGDASISENGGTST
ncbi:MAG: Ig-like domain-containing protein, partial [Verrucomicrobiales bacterium]|nr:Ig-like domain-containing protein [Verrucomicrobiales bacterium]